MKKQSVNLLVGRFQPMTLGHLKCTQAVDNPTLIAMIEVSTKNQNPKRPFLSSDFLPIYQELLSGDPNIADIVLVKSADIVKIMEIAEQSGYEIVSWTCGSDRFGDYKKMADKYAPGVEVIEIPRSDEDISATQVRQAIKAGDKNKYKRLSIDKRGEYFDKFSEVLNSVKESLSMMSFALYHSLTE